MGKKKPRKTDDDWENDIQAEIEQMQNPGSSSVTQEKGENQEKNISNDISTEPAVGEKIDQPSNKNNKKKKKKNKGNGDNQKSVSKDTSSLKVETQTNLIEKADSQNVDSSPLEPTVETKSKKKKKKGKNDKKEEKPKKGGLNKRALAMLKEQRAREEEERKRLEEEENERIRLEEERIRKIQEEEERKKLAKEKAKQKKKDRIALMKKEGTYKTKAQKENEKKNKAFLDSLRAQGKIPGQTDEVIKKKPVYNKKKKPKFVEKAMEEKTSVDLSEKLNNIELNEIKKNDDEESDDWDKASDISEDNSVEITKEVKENINAAIPEKAVVKNETLVIQDPIKRIQERKNKAEVERSTENLRAPVICVMGHVDTGKTKILDKLRKTNVQDNEAGGITQQIGATNVPTYAIEKQTKMVNNFDFSKLKIPGLLIIDTPGHESFSNLRSRGSSNCDMAILVVDIMHGLEPQTIESIKMLKKGKVPFVIALNKIDRLYQWKSDSNKDVEDVIKSQERLVKEEFQKQVNYVVVQFAEQELNVKLFYENDNPKEYISMIPTSAHSGDGMGNLMAMVVNNCQKYLAKKLAFSNELQCTVLEVKDSVGLGMTIDVLLVNGSLKYGDTIVLAGQEGPIVTHIKGLHQPEPMKEFRVKNSYKQHSKVSGAQGVRISAKDLDKALAGTQLLVACNKDEIEILKKEAQSEVDTVLKNIKVSDKGVYVQASTIGSLEALLDFLKSSKIPYSGINIGPVHKKDVVKASVMLERDEQWAIIMAFDVKVEREANEHAESVGVRIFTADIIYHLQDSFIAYRAQMKKQKQEEFKDKVVFPCKFRILPNHVFTKRDPILVGVRIEAGTLHKNTPIVVPEKENLFIGRVTGIQRDSKEIETAGITEEVCVRIDATPGDAPKMVGRHFEENNLLVSRISRESIDLLKQWWRDDVSIKDWKLIKELKNTFDIM